MNRKKCLMCKEEKTSAHYIGVRSLLLDGSMPICRSCISKFLNDGEDDQLWNRLNKVCQLGDIPFLPEEFEKLYKANKTDAFGNYCYLFRDKEYQTLDWTQYNDAYLQLKEEDGVVNGLPQIKAAKQRALSRKWGLNYDETDLVYLENLYIGITATSSVIGALNDDQVLKLCKVSLIIEEKIRAGQDFDKELKSYENLCKLAGVTTQSVKEGSEFNSTGELWAYLEKLGYKAKYYDGAVKDEIDKSMKDIKYWTRYLYINETGIAEEIKERIEGLKTADKITGSGFDWGEYEDFAEEVDDNEEFDIDI